MSNEHYERAKHSVVRIHGVKLSMAFLPSRESQRVAMSLAYLAPHKKHSS